MKSTPLLAAIGVIAALLLSPPARAGDGHAHGDAAPAATGAALPRFAAVSDAFELVGVLKGRHVTVYLDRSADNAPVTGAQIELEIGGAKLTVAPHEDAYEGLLAAEPTPGVLPITATVTAGQEVDLLAGELDLHEAAPGAEADHAPTWPTWPTWPAWPAWQAYAGGAAAATAVIGVLALLGRRSAAARQRRTGAAT